MSTQVTVSPGLIVTSFGLNELSVIVTVTVPGGAGGRVGRRGLERDHRQKYVPSGAGRFNRPRQNPPGLAPDIPHGSHPWRVAAFLEV